MGLTNHGARSQTSPFVSYMCCGKSTPTQNDAAALARKAVVQRGATATPIATVVAR
jgi:hypothetical protein